MIAEMFRRHLLALGAITAVGTAAVGELVELPGPVPLPSQLSYTHVGQMRALARRLGEAGNACGAGPAVLSAATAWAERLLGVAASAELVRRALMVAVAELHIEAGWSGLDAAHYNRAVYHFTAALKLATETRDAYLQSIALKYAGMATVEHGHPDDGLKMIQFNLVKARDIPRDEQCAVVVGVSGRAAQEACTRVQAATALAHLGFLDAADVEMAKSRQLWSPTRTDRFGDLDRPAALLALRRGRLDVAESFAAASVRRSEGISQIGRTHSGVVLATTHVRAGEPGGLPLAHDAITAVAKISSVRVRKRLDCWPTRWRPVLARMRKTCPEWPIGSPESGPDLLARAPRASYHVVAVEDQPEAESSTASHKPPRPDQRVETPLSRRADRHRACCGLGDRVTVLAHAIEVETDRLAHLGDT
ncbi:MAG: hypothetical protein ACRDSZ_10020 [Pseudonocardiaceae bacterium]